ncbi:MAG: amino acid adenylation domain-containing protein [Cyanobium sp. CZS 25K]|nr:amino acid adenylation domain-containing protein [Cyanobium sp. CZS25K]
MKRPRTILEALQIWRDQDPQAPALCGTQGPWLSRADLGHRLEEGHRVLRQAGLGASERLAVLMPQGLDGAVVALQVAGACSLAPLRAGTPAERWPAVLQGLAPAALVLAPGGEPALAAAAKALGIPVLDPELLFHPAAEGKPEVEGEGGRAGQFIVIATSGTTGVPKWVCHSQASLLGGSEAMARSLALSPDDRTLLALPLHHVHGLVSALLMPLASGGSVVVAEGFDPAAVLSCVAEHGISWISLPPAMHRALLDQHGRIPLAAGHRLRFLRSGAISLPGRLIDELRSAFGVPVIEAYGMSECPHICGNPIDAPRPGSVGKPVVEELAVVDGAGKPLPVGAWGQVVVRGRPVMAGYLGPEQASAAACRDGWLQTGDEGRLDREGYLELRGRLSERINRGGLKVTPAVVDAALLQHPGVREAMAFALPHPTLSEDLAAAVVLQPGAGLDEQELRDHAFQLLAPHEVPTRILLVEAFPRGPTGKVQRSRLAEAFAVDLAPRHDEPRSELEDQIAATFAAVLRQPPPGRHANFFQLGGDSLSGMRVIQALEQQLGLSLPPSLLFACPSPRTLAEQLAPMRNARSGQEGENQELCADPGELKRIPTAQPLAGTWPPGCEAFPASQAQARLWFLHQLEPDLTAYHLPALWRLRGVLDVAVLEQALGALIERHPTLRTSFQLRDREVVQIVHPAAPFALKAEALAARNPAAVIQEWLEQEQRTPFDLTAGLLLGARLLAVDDRHHLLLINHHHIASDGWSRSVLARDLVELYNAHHSGRSPDHQPLSVHYQDYATWQRQRLSGHRLRELRKYWISELMDLEPLQLPADRPRPAMPTHCGGSVGFTIESALLEPFEELCRREGATLQMGLLAVVALLLHRYSRQDDLAIGVPIWGRNHPELENLIGFFINTLPIRTRFEPGLSFRELLAQVRDASIGAYDHQELPFEQMVEALNLARDTSRNPLVQVTLQLVELPGATLQMLDGLDAESLPSGPETCRFDLEFVLRRAPRGGLNGQILLATDLFDVDRIERQSSHLVTLLASAVQAPDAPAAALNCLAASERQRIELWQQGPSLAVPALCIHQLFELQVERSPDAIALVFGDQALTYSELNARANRLAHALIARGVGPEVIVALALERSIDLVVVLLAILKAGGAYLPLDPAWPLQSLGQILEDVAPAVVISPADWEIPGGTDRQTWLLHLSDHPLVLDGRPAPNPLSREHHPRQLAYLTTTSGSTGRPKGVLIEHRSILRLLDPTNPYAIRCGDRMLQLAPLSFDAATFEIWGALLNGATLVMAPPGQLSVQELAALLRQQRISTLWLTAGLFQTMIEEQPEALAGVRQILAGGDVLAPCAVQRLLDRLPAGHQLINGYGPTENTTFTCCHRLAAGDALDPGGLPIGRPIAATLVRVLDRDGHLCPIGVPGELHIGGAGLARGYLNNPELTAETFIADPFAPGSTAGLYRSGDLVSWNADGSLAFHGRIDQQIKLRGFRIEPGEIEAHLLAHPAVGQAVVVLRRDDPSNPRLIAYWVQQTPGPSGAADGVGAMVRAAAAASSNQTASAAPAAPTQTPTPTSTPTPASPATADQLRSFLAERLPDSMVPAAFVELEALPLTTNGKLDRNALPAPSFSGDQEQRVDPRTERERELHAIWADVLGHDDFGITDNFFHIGGHSLVAARLIQRINDSGIAEIGVAALFQHPTIAALAQLIGGERSHDPRRFLVSLQPQGEAPPLFVIHGGAGDVFVFVALARALAPDRPVYGLQAIGLDGTLPRHTSVEQMAAAYATEIRAFYPSGPYHLIGYSAGGWYAHAVAAELLRFGGSIGLLAVVDTGATADLHRRVRAPMVAGHLLRRLPLRLRELLDTGPSQLGGFLHQRASAMRFHLAGMRRQQPINAPEDLETRAVNPTLLNHSDYYVKVQTLYRPPRLPVAVDVLSTRSTWLQKQWLWRFYARRGVRWHPVLDRHDDFFNAALMPPLADLLRERLREIEAGSTTAHPRSIAP